MCMCVFWGREERVVSPGRRLTASGSVEFENFYSGPTSVQSRIQLSFFLNYLGADHQGAELTPLAGRVLATECLTWVR